jgi:predicted transcriptional regulator of viral defense system
LTFPQVYPSLGVGFLETERHSVIRYTDLERTIIDCIDRIEQAGGLEVVKAAIGACAYLNENKLKEYLNAYDKNFLYQKAGYLLSKTNPGGLSEGFFAHCKSRMGARKSYMTENAATGAVFNSDWNLFVPDDAGYGEFL